MIHHDLAIGLAGLPLSVARQQSKMVAEDPHSSSGDRIAGLPQPYIRCCIDGMGTAISTRGRLASPALRLVRVKGRLTRVKHDRDRASQNDVRWQRRLALTNFSLASSTILLYFSDLAISICMLSPGATLHLLIPLSPKLHHNVRLCASAHRVFSVRNVRIPQHRLHLRSC